MTPELQKISSHHWLKHREQKCFHAFLTVGPGSTTMCDEGLPITDLKKMDIPGDRSPLCNKCVHVLYNFTPYAVVPKEKR